MDVLRNEIIEAQKHRSDLLKWKLLLVAGLGTAGLSLGGFASKNPNPGTSGTTHHFQPELLLCLIPFVCLYVDFLCRHLNLRISVIGQFLRYGPSRDHVFHSYEDFCCNAARDEGIFALENWALQVSSYVVTALVLLYGAYVVKTNSWTGWLLVLAGIAGLVLSWVTRKSYRRRSERLETYARAHFGAENDWCRQ